MTVLCRCFLFTNSEMSKVNPPLKMISSIHKNNLLNNKHFLKILRLNCQSLASTFPKFEAMNYECNFDILTLSETWSTENRNLLDYVELSGYDLYYNNRENKRGGGVATYVRESLKCKIRKVFCSLDTDIEHL